MQDDTSSEITSFQTQEIWKGGYFEGDPLDPIGISGYFDLGFISVLYATYLRCIKPYVDSNSVCLEIGPGRGAWTKILLAAREVHVIDVMSAEYNGFYEYVGRQQHVTYHQVNNFKCETLPDQHFTYMFSFGCLCHISFAGIRDYATNLFSKFLPGSNCFWMIADYDKYNAAVKNYANLSVVRPALCMSRRYPTTIRRTGSARVWRKLLHMGIQPRKAPPYQELGGENERKPGRWFHAGVNETCNMLKSVGYRVIDPDVGTIIRDPIIHFVKP
jgi:hypothetical protein